LARHIIIRIGADPFARSEVLKQLRICVAGLVLIACGGSRDAGTAPTLGPLTISIVAGDEQIATAGSTKLDSAVVVKVTRSIDGTVSGVTNAQICANPIDAHHRLTASTACANTAIGGEAAITFTPDTTAGLASAEIRGTIGTEPPVFDTVFASINPDTQTVAATFNMLRIGTPEYAYQASTGSHIDVEMVHVDDTLDLTRAIRSATDRYNNPLPSAVAWTLTQLSTDTLTDNGNQMVSGWPPFGPPRETVHADHTGSIATATHPGYVELWVWVNGVIVGAPVLAVLP
jgi:hypothetical protein